MHSICSRELIKRMCIQFPQTSFIPKWPKERVIGHDCGLLSKILYELPREYNTVIIPLRFVESRVRIVPCSQKFRLLGRQNNAITQTHAPTNPFLTHCKCIVQKGQVGEFYLVVIPQFLQVFLLQRL